MPDEKTPDRGWFEGYPQTAQLSEAERAAIKAQVTKDRTEGRKHLAELRKASKIAKAQAEANRQKWYGPGG